jgi:hypothetical protein
VEARRAAVDKLTDAIRAHPGSGDLPVRFRDIEEFGFRP